MKVAGFTFIRNAIKYDYPIVEAIQSILALCDEVVVAVGQSEDDTLNLIQNIDSDKIKIIETTWDDSLREGGQVLALETDKAFKAISKDSDWAIYIQGDEVLHEQYIDHIRQQMKLWKDTEAVDGLLFHYKHFYGSYDYVGESNKWYKNEIRIIKNNPNIYSYQDAQGFRKKNNKKLQVKLIDAYIYHYGWVKDPRAMQKKQEDFNKLWHSDQWVQNNVLRAEKFDYSNIDSLSTFDGRHPQVMQERIDKINWKFDYNLSQNKVSIKDKTKRFLAKKFGLDFSYKNYIII